MQIIKDIKEFEKLRGDCCLTIGNFDGVHTGHQRILSAAKKASEKGNLLLAAATFEPHPVAILNPEKTPERLTTLALKERLLDSFEVDYVFLMKADRKLLSLSPQDFVKKIIVQAIRPKVVVEGSNFRFGANRSGNIDTLKSLGRENGFEVVAVEQTTAKLSDGEAVNVSSTLIRNLLIEGKVSDALTALGRPYRLIGKVVAGKGKGKMLGFPTANLDEITQLIPAEGVYAAIAVFGDREIEICGRPAQIPSAISIGRAPTFRNDELLLVEAHLLAENVENLYGKWMAIDFIEKIRDQQKFANEKELAEQIAEDCSKARHILPHPKI
jgi:riboflavin kinase/FMN adenylyltransferase